MVLHDIDLALQRTKAATWVAHCGGLELRLRPFHMPLFIGVRGRGILRSSELSTKRVKTVLRLVPLAL